VRCGLAQVLGSPHRPVGSRDPQRRGRRGLLPLGAVSTDYSEGTIIAPMELAGKWLCLPALSSFHPPSIAAVLEWSHTAALEATADDDRG
jgi:hypothetical protein